MLFKSVYDYGTVKRKINLRSTHEKVTYASPWADAQAHVDYFYTSPHNDPLFLWIFYNLEEEFIDWLAEHRDLEDKELNEIASTITSLPGDYIYMPDVEETMTSTIDAYNESLLKRLEWIHNNHERLGLEIPNWLKQLYADIAIIKQRKIIIDYSAEQYD